MFVKELITMWSLLVLQVLTLISVNNLSGGLAVVNFNNIGCFTMKSLRENNDVLFGMPIDSLERCLKPCDYNLTAHFAVQKTIEGNSSSLKYYCMCIYKSVIHLQEVSTSECQSCTNDFHCDSRICGQQCGGNYTISLYFIDYGDSMPPTTINSDSYPTFETATKEADYKKTEDPDVNSSIDTTEDITTTSSTKNQVDSNLSSLSTKTYNKFNTSIKHENTNTLENNFTEQAHFNGINTFQEGANNNNLSSAEQEKDLEDLESPFGMFHSKVEELLEYSDNQLTSSTDESYIEDDFIGSQSNSRFQEQLDVQASRILTQEDINIKNNEKDNILITNNKKNEISTREEGIHETTPSMQGNENQTRTRIANNDSDSESSERLIIYISGVASACLAFGGVIVCLKRNIGEYSLASVTQR